MGTQKVKPKMLKKLELTVLEINALLVLVEIELRISKTNRDYAARQKWEFIASVLKAALRE